MGPSQGHPALPRAFWWQGGSAEREREPGAAPEPGPLSPAAAASRSLGPQRPPDVICSPPAGPFPPGRAAAATGRSRLICRPRERARAPRRAPGLRRARASTVTQASDLADPPGATPPRPGGPSRPPPGAPSRAKLLGVLVPEGVLRKQRVFVRLGLCLKDKPKCA